jgi:hypothetical protein
MGKLEELRKSVVGTLTNAVDTVKRSLDVNGGVEPLPDDAPENRDKVSGYCEQLFKDSQEWRKQVMRNRSRTTYVDVVDYWRDCRKLVYGNHFEVWGRRNDSSGEEWKAELQDDEIANQIRTKVNYMTGNWHDVLVMPNVKNINEVLDEERGGDWSKVIRLGAWKCKIEGTAHFKTVLTYEDNEQGRFKEILCDNEGIFPTPMSTGLLRDEGCWYLCHGTMENINDMVKRYPSLDRKQLAVTGGRKMAEISIQNDQADNITFENTRLVDHLAFDLDDDTLIDAEVDEEEIQRRLEIIKEGGHPKINEADNHLAFVQAYHDMVVSLDNQVQQMEAVVQPETQEATDMAVEQLLTIAQLYGENAQEHVDMMQKLEKRGIPIGKVQKYPFGRKIVVVGGKVAEDQPNPFKVRWRSLHHKWDNEKIPGEYYGRSDVEILYDVAKTEDTMLSITKDVALSTGIPKVFYHISDIKQHKKNGLNNDPLEPAYFNSTPPVFRQGQAPREFFEIYSFAKKEAEKRLAVNSTALGDVPGANSSAKLVQTLIRQNEPQLAGECNLNLSDCVESMMKTRLLLMREFFKEPRTYYIDGKFQVVNVSRILSMQTVTGENGQTEEIELPALRVEVKPSSNFPNQWESELSFMLELYNIKTPEGAPAIPLEAIYDVLQVRFPKLGTDGQYYKMEQALVIGLQEMKKRQQKAEEEQKDLHAIQNRVKQQGMNQLLGA